MLPDAPGLLSTTTFCPNRFESCSAIRRPLVSVTPPGVKGTTKRIGLVGYKAWAHARSGAMAQQANAMLSRSGIHWGFVRVQVGFLKMQRMFDSWCVCVLGDLFSFSIAFFKRPDVFKSHEFCQISKVMQRHCHVGRRPRLLELFENLRHGMDTGQQGSDRENR